MLKGNENTCERCTAWSQLMAFCNFGETTQAACLNPESPRHVSKSRADQRDWPHANDTCACWTRDPKFCDLI